MRICCILGPKTDRQTQRLRRPHGRPKTAPRRHKNTPQTESPQTPNTQDGPRIQEGLKTAPEPRRPQGPKGPQDPEGAQDTPKTALSSVCCVYVYLQIYIYVLCLCLCLYLFISFFAIYPSGARGAFRASPRQTRVCTMTGATGDDTVRGEPHTNHYGALPTPSARRSASVEFSRNTFQHVLQ